MVLLFTQLMGDAILRLIVTGDIPGTNAELGYKGSIVLAVLLTAIVVTYIILSQRRMVARMLYYYQINHSVELITL